MNNENMDMITPINNNQNTITPLEPINNQINVQPNNNVNNINKTNNETNDFVSGLPNWDLIPPYNVVKRVNR